ncbi:cytochrome P450 [Nocardia sp. NBC_00403]|uniref:cytochrome P450 n=1 Tax=Nocardia sp. NBC_00403 TaxID=2975990 RepID=UPI002E1E2847
MTAPTIAAAPGGLPVLGHALRLLNEPLEFFESLREHGDIVRIKLGPQSAYVLNSAELVRGVLVAKHRQFNKGAAIEGGRDLLGYGLISSEGDMHRRQRLMMQPAFHRERIAEYSEIMREQIVERTGAWRTGQTVDVRAEMSALTLAVTAKTLISSDVGNDLVEEMQHSMPRLFELLYQRLVTPLPALNKLPLPRNREYSAILTRLHPMIDKVIADYRSVDTPRNDLLGMLMQAQDESGNMLSDQEIHDQVASILVAGTETTAATLAFVFHLLTEHPDIEARLHAEVDEVLGGRPAEYADASRLTYTAQVISEALRYYPPAWILTRVAIEDVDLDGHLIPKGASVMFSPYIVLRDPRLFQDPDKFDPDRWGRERVAEIQREAMVHFGAGPRKCIGDVFAVVEATLALATMATGWRLVAAPGAVLDMVAATTLTPRNLFLTLEKRRS